MTLAHTSGWGWSARGKGGAPGGNDIAWLRPLVAAAPWITLVVLLVMMFLLGGSLAIREGVLFELPDSGVGEGESTSLVALMLPMSRETLVFFDDARFVLGDAQSMSVFRDQLSERAAKLNERTLLVLADRRIPAGEIMKFAAIAKAGGVGQILFAERRRREDEE